MDLKTQLDELIDEYLGTLSDVPAKQRPRFLAEHMLQMLLESAPDVQNCPGSRAEIVQRAKEGQAFLTTIVKPLEDLLDKARRQVAWAESSFDLGEQVEVLVSDHRGLPENSYMGTVTCLGLGVYEVTASDGVVHTGVFGSDMSRRTPSV